VTFRDDRDALAAQVDALTREADDLRTARDAAVGERDRLTGENRKLAKENERLTKELAQRKQAAPTKKAVSGPLTSTGAIRVVGFAGLLAVPILLGFLSVMCGTKKDEEKEKDPAAQPTSSPATKPPEIIAKEAPPDRRKELAAIGQLNLLMHDFDLAVRLTLAGQQEHMGDPAKTLAAFRRNGLHSTGVPALDDARAAYLTAADALLPPMTAANLRRRAGLPVAGDALLDVQETAFLEASRRLRDVLRPVLDELQARQHPFDRRAMGFVDLVLDERTPPADLKAAFDLMVAAFEADPAPRESAADVIKMSRAVVATVEKRGHSGLRPDVLHQLTMLQLLLKRHDLGTLRVDP
jgi:hypothetical protein